MGPASFDKLTAARLAHDTESGLHSEQQVRLGEPPIPPGPRGTRLQLEYEDRDALTAQSPAHAAFFRAARPYQIPERSKTTAQAPVNRIKNGEGNMNHATMAAPADKAAQM